MNINPASAQTASVTAGTSVLKQAIDMQAQTALLLINSIPQMQAVNPANLSPNLGQKINTTA